MCCGSNKVEKHWSIVSWFVLDIWGRIIALSFATKVRTSDEKAKETQAGEVKTIYWLSSAPLLLIPVLLAWITEIWTQCSCSVAPYNGKRKRLIVQHAWYKKIFPLKASVCSDLWRLIIALYPKYIAHTKKSLFIFIMLIIIYDLATQFLFKDYYISNQSY